MPTFKPKANKKIHVFKKYTTTLDGKHTEFMNEFLKAEQEVIPSLKEEKINLINKLHNDNTLSIEQIMEIKDRIHDIKQNIRTLKEKKNNYFLNNSNLIFEYFENKKNIDNIEETNKNNTTSKNQAIFNMFKVKINSELTNEEIFDKNNKNIVQKYFSNIDESLIDMNMFVKSTDICQSCYKGELIALEDDGIIICNSCFVNLPYLIENEKTSYKEPPKEVCSYAYKKINHWKEIIAQTQGKETTQIPDIVIEQILFQIKKERITLEELTHQKTKEILKKLGFNKYYEHIAFIKNKLGIKPPMFSPELEETLCYLFMEIQTPYAQVCPDYRVNFLNYHYVLYKLCELLDETQYLQHIPLLKDREKLIEQDETWKKMCHILDWEFTPTV